MENLLREAHLQYKEQYLLAAVYSKHIWFQLWIVLLSQIMQRKSWAEVEE